MTGSRFVPRDKNAPKTVGVNNWKLSGKVVKKKVTAGQNGGVVVQILLEVPAKNPKYTTQLWLKAFNSTKDPSKNIADQVDKTVDEGALFHFSGSFTSSDYVGQDQKKHHSEDKVIWQFEPAVSLPDDDQPF